MAVRLAEDRAKPALLLIHGFPGSSESFRKGIAALARGFVIAPDQDGHLCSVSNVATTWP